MALAGPCPDWLTFDRYGTLIQWDEGLIAAVSRILSRTGSHVDPRRFISIFDQRELRLEQRRPPCCRCRPPSNRKFAFRMMDRPTIADQIACQRAAMELAG